MIYIWVYWSRVIIVLHHNQLVESSNSNDCVSKMNTDNTSEQHGSVPDEKFVPRCSICGEKHWPYHPLVPCINTKKAKAKAKAERKARAKAERKAKAGAERQARAEARAETRAEKRSIAKAEAEAKSEKKAKAEAWKKARAYAQAKQEAETKAEMLRPGRRPRRKWNWKPNTEQKPRERWNRKPG